MHDILKRALETAETIGKQISRSDVIQPQDPLQGYDKGELIYLVGKACVEELIEETSRELRKEMELRLVEGEACGVTCVLKGGQHGVVVDCAEPFHTQDVGSRRYLVLVGRDLRWEKEIKVRSPSAEELEKFGRSEPPKLKRGDRVERNGERGVVVDERGVGSGFFERRLVRWAYSRLEVEELVVTLQKSPP